MQNPHKFDFDTTHTSAFRDFRFSKPMVNITYNPVAHPVSSRAPSAHYQTTSKRDWVRHSVQETAKIDLIPYP